MAAKWLRSGRAGAYLGDMETETCTPTVDHHPTRFCEHCQRDTEADTEDATNCGDCCSRY